MNLENFSLNQADCDLKVANQLDFGSLISTFLILLIILIHIHHLGFHFFRLLPFPIYSCTNPLNNFSFHPLNLNKHWSIYFLYREVTAWLSDTKCHHQKPYATSVMMQFTIQAKRLSFSFRQLHIKSIFLSIISLSNTLDLRKFLFFLNFCLVKHFLLWRAKHPGSSR